MTIQWLCDTEIELCGEGHITKVVFDIECPSSAYHKGEKLMFGGCRFFVCLHQFIEGFIQIIHHAWCYREEIKSGSR